MKRIESVAEYKELVATAKKSGYSLSNCFFFPTAIQQKVDQGILLALKIQNGLLILEDMVDFYRCYYYLSNDSLPEVVTLDKPAVVEFPFNGAMTPKQLVQVEKIYAMGFNLGRESSQMTLDVQALTLETLLPVAYELSFAQEADADAILEMLNKTFDKLYAFIPSKEELCRILKECHIWVLKDNGSIAALLHASQQKDYATIEHLVVAEQYRGQRLAAYLLQNYHNYYRDSVRAFCHWVDIHNKPAVKLYSTFGYNFGIKKANEYIKR